MNVWKYLLLDKIKLNCYILCVTFFQFVSLYYLWILNFMSYIYLWNHCKYMIVYTVLIYFLKATCLIKNKQNVCASNQKTTSSKLLEMPRQRGTYRWRPSKNTKISLTESSIRQAYPFIHNEIIHHQFHHLVLEVK